MQIYHLFFEGHFYIQKIFDNDGNVISLWPLNPWFVTKRWENKTNPTLYFDYDDGQNLKATFTEDQIWWNSILNCRGPDGQAIITLAKEALSVMMASDEVAGKTFANGMFASGFVTADKDAQIDAVEAQNVVDELARNFAGSRNAGKFTFIPYGAKFEKMSFTAEESQLLESRKWNAEEVVRLLGGAPLLVKLGYGEKNSTYASSSAFLEEYFNTSLMPLTVNIEQSILRDLIDPEDRGRLYAKYNADVSLRGSPRERAETNKVLIDSGQRTPNECRETDDHDPIDGWDIMFFPANSGMYDPETGEKFLPSQKAVQDVPDNSQNGSQQKQLTAAMAERILLKEEKSGRIDAKFSAKVLGIADEKASEYAQKRPAMSREQAKNLLIQLAIGETV
jgi:HK97 family phage portal protein